MGNLLWSSFSDPLAHHIIQYRLSDYGASKNSFFIFFHFTFVLYSNGKIVNIPRESFEMLPKTISRLISSLCWIANYVYWEKIRSFKVL